MAVERDDGAAPRLDPDGVEVGEQAARQEMDGAALDIGHRTDVAADEKPAGIGRRVLRRDPAEQHRGPHPEQRRRQVARAAATRQTVAKGGAVRDRAVEHSSQDAMPLDQREQLAGHGGGEVGDAAAFDMDPFVVRAGLREQRIGRSEARRDGTQNLHLFAAHDVGARVGQQRDAGDDGDVRFLDPGRGPRQAGEIGGGGDIGRLAPAACRADHTRRDDGQLAETSADRGDLNRIVVSVHRQHAAIVTHRVQHRAIGGDDIAASVGGAPIDRDIGGRHV